jgi:hypothetical protein
MRGAAHIGRSVSLAALTSCVCAGVRISKMRTRDWLSYRGPLERPRLRQGTTRRPMCPAADTVGGHEPARRCAVETRKS